MQKFDDFSANKNAIIERLQNGATLIFPTETIYGIGCSALSDNAVHRVFEAKGRAPDQPPPILIGNASQLDSLVAKIPLCSKALMDSYWPGSLTLILPARDDVPDLLCGWNEAKKLRTVGVRWTNHLVARVLCENGAPLVATSANFTGALGRYANPKSIDDIPIDFQEKVDMIIDDGEVGGVASTIVDCTGDVPRVLRVGAIDLNFG